MNCPRCNGTGVKHITKYAPRHGVSVLCQECFAALATEDRVAFYAGLVLGAWLSPLHNPHCTEQERADAVSVQWPMIRDAVLAESTEPTFVRTGSVK